ncbi:MAG TPA: hypothetical protein VMB47_04385 [Candidatus Aquilonibacter sp.]|nr:hypothetical protein [Candidatus Aquilonibacter sp.]
MISWRGRWEKTLTWFRMHSQVAGFVLGLVIAGVAASLWYRKMLGEIWGSFLVGVGAAIIAAAVFAYLSPFNEPAFRRFLSLSIDYFWPSREAIEENYWVDHLHNATEKCFLLGIAHGGWCRDRRFAPTLSERLDHGLLFKMFFLNPESSAAALRADEEKKQPNGRDTREQIRNSIKIMWELRGTLEAGPRARVFLYVYTATPSCGLTWIDQTMLVTHYLAGLPDVTSPALLLSPPEGGIEGSLYNTYAKNLEKIENESILITNENVHRFLPEAHDEPQRKSGGA